MCVLLIPLAFMFLYKLEIISKHLIGLNFNFLGQDWLLLLEFHSTHTTHQDHQCFPTVAKVQSHTADIIALLTVKSVSPP
jgi:hypothetical protein